MTFSIEDLPAPFGPMMARISPARTSKLTSESALTPPKASEIFSTDSRISATGLVSVIASPLVSSRRALRAGARKALRVVDAHIGTEHAGAAVFELHHGFDTLRPHAAVERIDQRCVF